MNEGDNVMEKKMEIGSVVVSKINMFHATVLEFVDSKFMIVRWECDGEVDEVLREMFFQE